MPHDLTSAKGLAELRPTLEIAKATMEGHLSMKYLEALIAAGERERWIPVSERLPEPFQHVRVAGGVGYYDNQAGHWFSVAAGRRIIWEVTHWKPLDEPPPPAKEDEHG